MKKLLLKSKNRIAKFFLATLGFTLAASQCLAQYMAYVPKYVTQGKLTGITDTISRFRIVINDYDTLYTSYQQNYAFNRCHFYIIDSIKWKVEVSQDSKDANQIYAPYSEIIAIKPANQIYAPTTKIVAIKPEEERNSEKLLIIKLKKK